MLTDDCAHVVCGSYFEGQRLSRDEGPGSDRGYGLTRPADILLYGWRGDRHCCIDLVEVSLVRGGWRDALSALAVVEQAKREKHFEVCASYRFDIMPFNFSVFGSFELLHPKSSLTASGNVTALTPVFPSGRPTLGSTVISPLQLCVGWPISLSAAA